VFDHLKTPQVKVVQCIRMAISIPFVYTVKRFQDEIHVDGALINNFPIQMFEHELDSTIGIKFNVINENVTPITSFDTYIYQLIMLYIQQRKDDLTKYENSIVYVDVGTTKLLDFDLSLQQKKELVQSGYNGTKAYFEKLKQQSECSF